MARGALDAVDERGRGVIVLSDGQWHDVLTCRDCGREWCRPISRGRKPLRCPTCATPSPHECHECDECGVPIEQSGPGRRRRWCSDCAQTCRTRERTIAQRARRERRRMEG